MSNNDDRPQSDNPKAGDSAGEAQKIKQKAMKGRSTALSAAKKNAGSTTKDDNSKNPEHHKNRKKSQPGYLEGKSLRGRFVEDGEAVIGVAASAANPLADADGGGIPDAVAPSDDVTKADQSAESSPLTPQDEAEVPPAGEAENTAILAQADTAAIGPRSLFMGYSGSQSDSTDWITSIEPIAGVAAGVFPAISVDSSPGQRTAHNLQSHELVTGVPDPAESTQLPLSGNSLSSSTQYESVREDDVTHSDLAGDFAQKSSSAEFTPTTEQSQYGELTVSADGQWRYQLNNNSLATQHLADHKSVSDTFVFTALDGSTHTVIVRIFGQNDAPVINAVSAHSVTEDGATLLGQVYASDIDKGDRIAFSTNSDVAGFQIDAGGHYQFDPGASAYQSLAVGQSQVLDIPILLTDNHGLSAFQNLQITVTGSNDAPQVVQVPPSQLIDEGAAFQYTLAEDTFFDVDATDSLTLSAGPLPSWLQFDSATATFSGTPGPGDLGTEYITVTATDSQGAKVATTFSLLVGSNNDAPVFAPINAVTVDEDGQRALGQLVASDPNTGDSLHYSSPASIDGFVLNNDGSWVFDPSAAAYQSLPDGEHQVLTIPVTVTDTAGANDTKMLTITVIGTNDTAVISGVDTGSVQEDATLICSGKLGVADIDVGEDAFVSVSGAPGISGYGAFSVGHDGTWTFQVDNNHPSVQQLGVGEQLTDSFIVNSIDGVQHTIAVTINGSNDTPILAHAMSTQTATQNLAFNFSIPIDTFVDVDSTDHQTYTVAGLPAWATFDPASVTISGTPGNADVGSAPITVTATDTQGQSVATVFNLEVHNTNDPPVLNPIATLTTTEDGTQAFGQFTASDIDNGDILHYSSNTVVDGLTVNIDGSWTFDPSDSAYQALANGQTQTLTIPITVTDSAGAADTQNLVINIIGTNDTPVISTIAAVAVDEDAAIVSGTLSSFDADVGDTLTYSIANPVDGLRVNADGSWLFDPSHTAYQSLAVGQQLELTVPVTVTDGFGDSDTQNLIIHMTGTNDVPVLGAITPVKVDEGDAVIKGTLTASDSDNSDSLTYFTSVAVPGFTLNADGSYQFDPSSAVYDYLAAGQQQIVSVPIIVADGKGGLDSQQLQITLNGTNDVPIVSGIDHAIGSVAGAGNGRVSITGKLDVLDADVGENHFQPQLLAGSFGVLTIDQGGQWNYTADSTQPVLTQLQGSASVAEDFTIRTADGTEHHIQLEIRGQNSPAIIGGVSSALIHEDHSGTVQQQLTITDPNVGENAFVPLDIDTSYGHITLNANGLWTYAVNNNNALVQALGDGQTLQERITVGSVDGTARSISVHILGVNDDAVITGVASGVVSEDVSVTSSGTLQTSGLLSITDVDSGENYFNPIQNYPGDHGYGQFTIDAQGHWSYQVDNSDPAIQQLAAGGQELTDSTVVRSADGTEHTITVYIQGRNDAPAVSHVVSSQAASEDAAFSFALPAGTFNDIDTGDTLTISAGNLPTWLSFDATTGTFSGTPANSDVGTVQITVNATDALGATVSTTFDLTVANTNDAPVLNPIGTINVMEDGQQAKGQLTAFDPDAGDTLSYSAASNVDGFVLNSDGSWTFDPADSAYQSLSDGAQQTLTIPVTVTDAASASSTQNLVIQLTGTNDLAVITGVATDSVKEDLYPTAAHTLNASGRLQVIDPDSGESQFVSDMNMLGQGGYGHFGILADGQWRYSADNNHPMVQALAQGETLTDSVVVNTADGTPYTISVTIQGTNDTPVVSNALSAQVVYEDVAFRLAIPADTFADVDASDTLSLSASGLPAWASFDAATGVISGTPTNSDVGMAPITITASDTRGASVSTTFGLFVANTNDAPTLNAIARVAVDEDGARVSGQFIATDIDPGDTLSYSASTPVDGLTVNSDGSWSFDPSDSAYQSLLAGEQQVLNIPVTVTDSAGVSNTQTLTITLTGTNDIPRVGGASTGFVQEDLGVQAGYLSVSGDMTVTDADAGQSLFVANAALQGTYGTLSISEDGHWSYSADNGQSVIQQLGANDTLTDTFSVETADGTQQNITITLIGSNDATVVTATTTAPFDAGDTLEDTPLTFSEPDLLSMLGATDIDASDTLSIAGASSPHGTFTQQPNGDWLFTPETDYDGQKVPVAIRVIDGSNEVTAHGFVDIAPVTDLSRPNIVLTSHQEVIDTGPPAGLGRIQVDQVANGQMTGFTLEVNLLAKPVADTNTWTGPVVLNMGNPGNNNFLTLWNPGNLKIGGMGEPATGLNLGDGNVHRLTMTWESSSGQFTLFDNGQEVHSQVWHQGQPLPDETYLLIGGKNHNPSGVPRFLPAEHFEGQIFNVAMTETVLSAAEVKLAPLASQVDVNSGLTMDIRSVGGHVSDITGVHTTSDNGAIGVDTGVDASLNLPAPGSMLHLELQAPEPADPDDHVSRVQVTGFLAGTQINDGPNSHIFNGPNEILDVTGWALDAITAILPPGISENMQLLLTVETTGPAGSVETSYTEPVILNPLLPLPTAVIGGDDLATTDEDTAVSGTLTITDADPGEDLFIANSITGQMGELTVDQDGSWTYTPSNHADSLKPGDVAKDSMVVSSADGTTHLITITLNGNADGAVISGIDTVIVGEDQASVSSGKLDVWDRDAGEAQFTVSTIKGHYGTLAIDADGNWDYTADNTLNEIQQLASGDTLTEAFTVSSVDGTSHNIAVTIVGTNDAPVLSTISAQAATEDGAAIAGRVSGADIDIGDSLTYALATPVDGIRVDADGNWSFDPSHASYQALSAGEIQTVTATIIGTDSAGATDSQNLVITLTGTNDTPSVAHAITTQSATEDAAFSFTVSTDTFTDLDASDSLTYSATGLPAWATFNATTGVISGTPTHNDVGTVPVTITAIDGQGASVSTTFSLLVANTNDAPTLTPIGQFLVDEDGAQVSGQFTATDPDTGDTLSYSIAVPVDGLTVNSDGSWTFDPSDPAYQALTAGQTQTLTIPITVTDADGATDTQNLVIELTGTNDQAQVSGADYQIVQEDATFGVGAQQHDLFCHGQLFAADPDKGESIFTASSGTSDLGLGSFTIDENGVWQYVADNTQLAIQSLADGDKLHDTFTIASTDGTRHTVKVDIWGSNDAPTVAHALTTQIASEGAAFSFSVPSDTFSDIDAHTRLHFYASGLPAWLSFDPVTATFSGTPRKSDVGTTTLNVTARDQDGDSVSATFNLNVEDVNDAPVLTPISAISVTEDSAKAFGQFTATDIGDTLSYSIAAPVDGLTVNTDGSWTFDPTDSAYQALTDGQVQKLTIPITVTDAAGAQDTQNLVIELTGNNDTAMITGVDSGAVQEDLHVNAGKLSASGQLLIAEPDAGENSFVADAGSSDYGYGVFDVDASGAWTFSVDNSAIQMLGEGDVINDQFSVVSVDGTSHQVSVTIAGTNDTPTVAHAITAQTAIEDAAFSFTVPKNTFTDLDATAPLSYSAAGLPSWASFDATNGVISGTPSDSDVGAVPIIITATDAQGASASTTFDLVVDNTNDAPTLNAINTVSVTEGGALAAGQLTATDPDSGDTLAFSTLASLAGFSLSATGHYLFNPADPSFESLAAGQHQTLTIPVTVTDAAGAEDTINLSFDIVGTNDSAVVTGATAARLTEDQVSAGTGDLSVAGALTVADPDQGEAAFVEASGANALTGLYGTLDIDASGLWSYTADNSQPAIQQLNTGDTLTDTLTIQTVDGTTQDIVITIAGRDDGTPAVISGQTIGGVTEDQSVTAMGKVYATDPDAGEERFVPGLLTGQFGELTINQWGNWEYTLDSTLPQVQNLNYGEFLHDTITIRSLDGTTQDIVIAINGADENSPAHIFGTDNRAVFEDDPTPGTNELFAAGTLTVSDPDPGESLFEAHYGGDALQGSYGTLNLFASGLWNYRADNSQSDIQNLNRGESLTEHFTVQSVDGTAHTITVTLMGVDDAQPATVYDQADDSSITSVTLSVPSAAPPDIAGESTTQLDALMSAARAEEIVAGNTAEAGNGYIDVFQSAGAELHDSFAAMQGETDMSDPLVETLSDFGAYIDSEVASSGADLDPAVLSDLLDQQDLASNPDDSAHTTTVEPSLPLDNSIPFFDSDDPILPDHNDDNI